MREKWEKGFCYYCDKNYEYDHKCKMKHIFLLGGNGFNQCNIWFNISLDHEDFRQHQEVGHHHLN